jgi:hypothetical protein
MGTEIDSSRDNQCLAEENENLRQAILIAAAALEIASDWNLPAVQVDPPREWGLDGGGEDPAHGWCSTMALANKLRELATKSDVVERAEISASDLAEKIASLMPSARSDGEVMKYDIQFLEALIKERIKMNQDNSDRNNKK